MTIYDYLVQQWMQFIFIQNGHMATSLVETIYRDACTLISVNYSEIRCYLVSDITQHHVLCYMPGQYIIGYPLN